MLQVMNSLFAVMNFFDSFADYRFNTFFIKYGFSQTKYRFLYTFTVFQVYALKHIFFGIKDVSSPVYLLTILSIYFLVFLVNVFFD